MKKIICTVLSLIIALSMVACGDTAPVQTDNAEDTLTSEGLGEIGGTEVIENTDVHCDFDTLVMNYMEVEGITSMDDEQFFLFCNEIANQGINPTTFTCDNPYYQGYLNYWNQLQQAATETPAPQSPTKESGDTYTTKSGTTYPIMEGNKGPTIPVEEVDQFIYEEMGAETYDLIAEARAVGSLGISSDKLAKKIELMGIEGMKDYYDEYLPGWIAQRKIENETKANGLESDREP